jgi:predicted double-glycine peptidase
LAARIRVIWLCVTAWAPVVLADTSVPVVSTGQRLSARVVSFLEMRERNLVRQGWDISCGAAAHSTVLSHHFGTPYSEATIAVSILANTDPDRVRERGGFSLLDLKRFAEAVGYSADGYANLTLEDLAAANVPAILPVRIRNLDHFVVFRGRVAGKVLIGDPAFGNLTLSEKAFARIWTNGIGFLVASSADSAPTWRSQDAIALTVPDLNYVYRLGSVSPARVTRR